MEKCKYILVVLVLFFTFNLNVVVGCPHQSMADIVTEQGEFAGLPDEEMYSAKLGVFQILERDSSYMHAGYASDVVLQNFYDSAYQTNMGMLYLVNELIADSLNLFATSINSWISPVNHFEENIQMVNDIYLNTWAEDIFEFDSIQEYSLTNIANENPISGGNAVYIARVMLDLFVDDFITNSIRQSDNVLNFRNESLEIEIYPIPAKQKLSLNIKSAEMINCDFINTDGKIITQLELSSSENEIDISNFANGMYCLKFYSNKKIFANKIIVINR